MTGIVVDTHTMIWYLSQSTKLSASANIAIDTAIQSGHPVYLSAISIVEITYLVEKNRIPQASLNQLITLLNSAGSGIVITPIDFAIAQAIGQISRTTVPEMPDRIIAATAFHLQLPLVTRDHKIQALTNIQIIW